MVHAEIDPTDPRRIEITQTSPMQKDLFNTIPGTRWSHKRQSWHMPLGCAGCLALRSTFRDNLEFGEKLALLLQALALRVVGVEVHRAAGGVDD